VQELINSSLSESDDEKNIIEDVIERNGNINPRKHISKIENYLKRIVLLVNKG